MEELIKIIRKNERWILLALPILMAVVFAFLPMADVFGKTTANGVKLIFDGNGLGFGRFCATMSLLLPIAAIVLQFVTVALPPQVANRFNLIWAGGSLIFIVLMAIALPAGVSLAWGGYIYCLLAIAGIAIDFLPKQ